MHVTKLLRNYFKEHLAYFLFALITILLFGKTLYLSSNEMISNGDIQRSHYYFQSFVQDSLMRGELPFWNPYTFSGYPFLANPSVNLFYPANWLLYVFTPSHGFAWHMAFHIWLACSGMYWLLRRFVKPFPAFIGALAFGLSGRFTPNLYAGAYDVNAGASWIPWTIGSIWIALDKKKLRFIFLSIIILCFQILSGYQTMTIFAIQIATILLLFLIMKQRSVMPIFVFGFILLSAIGLTSFQLLPTQELVASSIRSYEKPYEWYMSGEIIPDDLKMLWNPSARGGLFEYASNGVSYWEHSFYTGKVPFILACLGVLSIVIILGKLIFRKRVENGHLILVLLGSITVIGGFWLSLGHYTTPNLMYYFWTYLPWYHFIRIPARHLMISVFGLALLTGIGAHYVEKIRFVGKYIIILGAILTVIDLYLYGIISVVSIPISDTRQDFDLISLLQRQEDPDRFHPGPGLSGPWPDAGKHTLDANAPMKYKIFSDNGYDLVILKNYYQFMNALNDSPDMFTTDLNAPVAPIFSPGYDFLNIRYYGFAINEDPVVRFGLTGFTHVITKPVRKSVLYRKNNTLPRFFVVPNITKLQNRQEIYDQIKDNKVNYLNTVLVDKNIDTDKNEVTCTDSYNVSLISYQQNNVSLQSAVDCSGYLVSSEVMYPGWEAFIDKKQVPLFEGNLAFRTLFLPAGNHEIEFRYNPRIFYYGIFVTITTGTILSAIFLLKRKITFFTKHS